MKIKLLSFLIIIIVTIIIVTYDTMQSPDLIVPNDNQIININPIQVPEIDHMISIDNKILSLDDIKTEIILINFWASWCASCITELPSMIQLIERHQGRVTLLTISIDDSISAVEKFKIKLQQQYKISPNQDHIYWIWDKEKYISLKLFNTIKIPETFIVNKERLIINKIIGTKDWSEITF